MPGKWYCKSRISSEHSLLQTIFGIFDESEWTGDDRSFSYETFFKTIVDLFEDPADPWCKETLEYWNQ